MAIKASGIGELYGVPGLAIVLVGVALWFGTRFPNTFSNVPILGKVGDATDVIGVHLLTVLLIFIAFWIGTQNPKLFDGVPILGKAVG